MAFLDNTGVASLVAKIKAKMPTEMVGATYDAAGTAGIVPAPPAFGGTSAVQEQYRKYLCSDGKWRGFRTYMNTVESSGAVRAYINIESGYEIGGTVSADSNYVRKKLWENASPSSSFGAQTITLSEDVENYLFWVIECYLSTTVQDKVVSFMCVGRNGHRLHFAGSGSNSNRGNSRDMEIDSTGTQLTFAANYYNNTSTNASLIPFKVFGFFHK